MVAGMVGSTAAESPGPVIAVGAVDDHGFILRGLAAYLLEHEPDIRMVAIAATVSELLATPATECAVVLLDVHLADGSRAERNVRELRTAGAHVVLLTSEHRPAVLRGAFEAGAVGLVLKSDPEAHVAEAVRAAHQGQFFTSGRLAHQVVADSRASVRLTERERDVLGLLARGLPWAAVARRLGVSPETARTHCYRAIEKYASAGGAPVEGPRDVVFRALSDGQIDLSQTPPRDA